MQNTRQRCTLCTRPLKTCLCHLVKTAHNHRKILILQHPAESFEAKGTGRLLHLCLEHSQLETGEEFSNTTLQHLLNEQHFNILLFPALEHSPLQASAQISPEEVKSRLKALPEKNVQLVIIDATWRKARKMLHLNPLLQALPRLI